MSIHGGTFVGETIALDGKSYNSCLFRDCVFVFFATSDPGDFSGCGFDRPTFRLGGEAEEAINTLGRYLRTGSEGERRAAEDAIAQIRAGGDPRDALSRLPWKPNVAIALIRTVRLLIHIYHGIAGASALVDGVIEHLRRADLPTRRGTKLVLENEHGLLDPAWASQAVGIKYGSSLAAFREVITFAADLCLRCFVTTSEPEDDAVIACEFRQVVACADAVATLLQGGAGYMARLPLRSMYEALLSMRWMLAEDTPRRGRLYLVASLRRHRWWQLNGTPDAAERMHALLWKQVHGEESPLDSEAVTDVTLEADQIERILNDPMFVEINRRFDDHRSRSGREHDPDWFKVDGVDSYAAMARSFGPDEELTYLIQYDAHSDAVHGRDHMRHLDLSGPNAHQIQFIRDPNDVPPILLAAATFLFRAMRTICGYYRPEELPALEARIRSDWAIRAVPREVFEEDA